MGSPSASNSQYPWAPYETSEDCSLGVCSVYCPQWCYMIFVPPPPPRFDYGASSYESSGINFSPLIIALIGIFGSAFIMITYYTIISKYCGRRGGASSASRDIGMDANANSASGSRQGANTGMEEALIKSIKVHKYKKNEGLVEETDCSVCLSEFEENESLRLLPKCSHAFHVPCIDAWLKSNASCPLCRSSISAPIIALVPQHHNQQQQQQVVVPSVQETSHREMNVSALEYHHTSNVSVLVVEEREQEDGFCLRNDEIQRLRRSVSLIEVLNLHDQEEEEEDLENQMENFQVSSDQREKFFKRSCQFSVETGTSKGDVYGERNCRVNHIRSGVFSLVKGPLELKRSISTGRFGFTRYAKENNCIIPH